MKVKALRYHENEFGGKFRKNEGDEYEIDKDLAKPLIANGYVEEVGGSVSDRGTAGTGSGSKRAS